MFLEICLAILLGMTAGVFTGLVPGLHVNLVTVIVVGLSGSLLAGISPLLVAIGIISLALTHSFLDSIPSIYLGAPDESQVLSVLPGHRMLLQGKGHHAILYTIVGSLVALFLTLLFFPIGINLLEPAYTFLKPYIGKGLLVIIIGLLLLSRKFFLNLFFFILSGTIGFLCFSLVEQTHILLPLLTGLFGTSTLLISYLGPTSALPKQKTKRGINLTVLDLEKNSLRATIVGILAAFLPGLGSSQSAIIASSTMRKKSDKDYLLLVGGINTVNFAFSLVTVAILAKARNGAIVGVNQLIGNLGTGIGLSHLFLFAPVLLIVGGGASILGVTLSKRLAKLLQKVHYKRLLLGVILFLVFMVVLLAGLQGLVILFATTALGVLANLLGAQKNMLLGCLLLPVLIYLW